MGALGTRGGNDRATRLVVGCSAPKLIVECRRQVGDFRRLGGKAGNRIIIWESVPSLNAGPSPINKAGRFSFRTSRQKKSISAESCRGLPDRYSRDISRLRPRR
uniref:Uncharacterized protein n=1 Tax=Ficus carica TaxID=3494 RepID=A0AA87YZX0_FICCA|nr:hypothetical protein TIFTF001_048610 [Ficus carica]